MGNTCKPMAVSFQGMTKFTTNKKKKKKLQLNTEKIIHAPFLASPICTGQAQRGEKTYKKQSQN